MEKEIPNNLTDLIEACSPDLREITFHTDGRVIAKTGARAKFPKKLYSAKPPQELFLWSDLAVEALKKLYKENIQ